MNRACVVCALAVVPALASAQPLNPSNFRIIDLTHPFNAQTIYWPTTTVGFRLEQLVRGRQPGGYYYSANTFSTPEHGGTHLDAPSHFSQTGRTADQIPLEQLVARAAVIDISAKAARDPDYVLSTADVREYERVHGRILPGTIVLIHTGWAKRWPNKRSYLGDDTPGDASRLHFPSFGAEAVRMLIRQRFIGGLGGDIASIDNGPSRTFAVHQLAAGANLPALENLTNLDQVPNSGATIIALPMKIQGGSGGPVRVIALVPK